MCLGGIYARSSDIFTDVDWRDGHLVAWTWECFKITVDQETGKPIEVLFTKRTIAAGQPSPEHWPV
jgi:hypothetical protein